MKWERKELDLVVRTSVSIRHSSFCISLVHVSLGWSNVPTLYYNCDQPRNQLESSPVLNRGHVSSVLLLITQLRLLKKEFSGALSFLAPVIGHGRGTNSFATGKELKFIFQLISSTHLRENNS